MSQGIGKLCVGPGAHKGRSVQHHSRVSRIIVGE